MHIAGSDRQKLCRVNRNVKLFDWRFQIANVKAVGFNIDPFLDRNDELKPARRRKYRAAPTCRYFWWFLGEAQPGQRKQTDHQTWHMTQRESC